jgi:nucleotide-binding universal stress UspA family protein
MLTIKRILFPTDFSRCSDQALIHAIYLSRRYTAELHVLNAIVLNEHLREGGIMAVSDLESELERQAAKHLASLGKGALASLPIVFSRHRGYSAAEVILDYVSGKDIDLVVMGTHGRRGLGHLLLGSVAEEVVRMATCPVLTLREKEHVPVPTEVSRILVPVDYSDHSREAIAYAKHLGHEYGARLQLLHVIEETIHPSFYVTGQSSVFSWFPELEAHARREMQSILSEVPGPKDGRGPTS